MKERPFLKLENKKRYAKQIRKTDCGLTAIANTMKWAGSNISYKSFYNMFKSKCDTTYGIDPETMTTILSQINSLELKKVLAAGFSLKQINKHLDNDGAVIIRYFHNQKLQGHYALCVGRTKHSYKMVNDSAKKTVRYVPAKTLHNKITRQSFGLGCIYFSLLWFMGKKKDAM